MCVLIKRLFKKSKLEKVTLYKDGKVYKFNSFKKATDFMQKGR